MNPGIKWANLGFLYEIIIFLNDRILSDRKLIAAVWQVTKYYITFCKIFW